MKTFHPTAKKKVTELCTSKAQWGAEKWRDEKETIPTLKKTPSSGALKTIETVIYSDLEMCPNHPAWCWPGLVFPPAPELQEERGDVSTANVQYDPGV